MVGAVQMEAMARKMEAQIVKQQQQQRKAVKARAVKAAPAQDDEDEDDVSVLDKLCLQSLHKHRTCVC